MARGYLAQISTVRFHRPDMKSAARIRLQRDEVAFRRPARMRGFRNRIRELLGLASCHGQRPKQTLQIHHDGLVVWGYGNREVSSFVNRDPLRSRLGERR